MAIFEPGPMEKFGLWLKSLVKPAQTKPTRPTQTAMSGPRPKKVWTRELDRERRVEVFARQDDLFSFREMKLVSKDDDTFDVMIYESGLYDDLKEITLAVSDYILSDGRHTRG